MTWAALLGGGALLVAGLALALARRRAGAVERDHRAALADPTRDPGAGRAGDDARRRLDAALALPDPAARARAALAAALLPEPWRAGLARLPLDGVPAGLRAEIRARLGHVAEASALAAGLSPEDGPACAARAIAYEAAGDPIRAEAAWVAAVWFADPTDRPRCERDLAALRGRWPRRRTDGEVLWDP